MIRIEAPSLELIARHLRLLKPTAATDGQNAHARHCHLAVGEGETLVARCTDSEFYFESRHRASGDLSGWAGATVLARPARGLFARLARLSGGRGGATDRLDVKIETSDATALEFSRKSFRARLPLATAVNPFPRQTLPGGTWSRVTRTGLQNVLDFLARSPGRDDPRDIRQECTLFQNQVGMANMKVMVRDEPEPEAIVALASSAPQLPFQLATTRHRASRLLAWLELLPKEGTGRVTDLEVAAGSDDSEGYYFVRDEDHKYTVWFPTSGRVFPRDSLERLRTGEAVATVVDRQTLLGTLALIIGTTTATALECRLKRTGSGWGLELRYGQGEGITYQNTLPVSVTPEPTPADWNLRFTVRPANLALALRRVRGKKVVVTYRAGTRLVAVRADNPYLVVPDDYQHDEVYFAAQQPPVSESPPEQSPTGGGEAVAPETSSPR